MTKFNFISIRGGGLILFAALAFLFSCKKDAFQSAQPGAPQTLDHTNPKLPASLTLANIQEHFRQKQAAVSQRSAADSIVQYLAGIELLWDFADTFQYAGNVPLIAVPTATDEIASIFRQSMMVFYVNEQNEIDSRLFFIYADSSYTEVDEFTERYTGFVFQFDWEGHMVHSLRIENGSIIAPVTQAGSVEFRTEIPNCPDGTPANVYWYSFGDYAIFWYSCGGGSGGGESGSGGSSNPPTGGGVVFNGHDPFGFGNNQNNQGEHNTGGGGGSASSNLSDYFDPNDFEGFEGKIAQLVNKMKDDLCLQQTAPELLENLETNCGLGPEPEDTYFELRSMLQNPGNLPDCAQEEVNQDRIEYIEQEYGVSIPEENLDDIILSAPTDCEGVYGDMDYAFSPLFENIQGEEINLNQRLDCFVLSGNENYSHKVTLYADQPVPNSESAYAISNGDVDPGHTFITIEQISSTGEIHRLSFGFYPETPVYPGVQNSSNGIFVHDESHPYEVSVTWNLSPTYFQQLITAAKTISSSNPGYNLNNYNCTTFATHLLNQIGIYVPENSGSWPGGNGLNPGKLGEDLRNLPLQPWMTRNGTGGISPSSKGCD